MWKVLIADDEPKIRRGLRAALERIRTDMKVVAEAEDGEMALALVQEHAPDILMIDIRMPFIDGLELIERINAAHRECIIVVVSGHDEFDYAKRALQLKVFEYILKPVSQDVLAGVLERAAAELARMRAQSSYLGWARDQLEKNLPILREQFFRDFVNGRLARSEVGEQVAFLGVGIGEHPALLMVHIVERFLGAGLSQERDRRLALFAAERIVCEGLRDFSPVSVFRDEHDTIVAILDTSRGPLWGQALAAIESRITQSIANTIVTAHKAIPQGIEGIPEAYEALAAEIAQKSSYRGFVLRAQEYIDSRAGVPELSLEEVAAEVEISPGYLSRLLKQETGFSFVDYLTRVRVAKAIQLMSDPAVKIYEVAEAVGYQSQHYFSRAFKKVLGRSPVEYRKGGGGN